MTYAEKPVRSGISDADAALLARLQSESPAACRETSIPPRSPSRHWLMAGGFALGILVAILATLVLRPVLAPPRTPPSGEAPAATAPTDASVNGEIELSGYIVARNRASVSSDITGRVRSIHVRVGEAVRAGDIIAYLDDREARLLLNAARLQANQRRLDLEAAATTLRLEELKSARVTQLARAGYMSHAAEEVAEAMLSGARVGHDRSNLAIIQAENAVRSAEIMAERHVIRAPFDGVVTEVTARPGETVSPSSGGNSFIRTGIIQLVDPTDMYVVAEVPENRLTAIAVGQAVLISGGAIGEKPVTSQIAWIAPISDRQRGMVEIGIDLPQRPAGAVDGMEVDVRTRALSVSADQPKHE